MNNFTAVLCIVLLAGSSAFADEQSGKANLTSTFTLSENLPQNNSTSPVNRAPKNARSFAVVLGSGTPLPNPYRMGPSFVVVSNGYPYFIDCGEGAWRGISKACIAHGWLTEFFDFNNFKYLFITHLHCDHTIGIPSWILNAYKCGSKASKEIYGPKGTEAMMKISWRHGKLISKICSPA